MNHYLTRVSIFLIMAALITGMAGCGPAQYNLTISSTEGGEVTTPGEGTFTYDKGTVVNLVAEPDDGYQFVNWSGNVSAIADVNAAATNITMNDHYSITANFAPEISENLEIWDWYDLDAMRDNLGAAFLLMKNLDSTTAGYTELASPTANQGKGWQPIGTQSYPFTGTFDGQGYEISDLFINRADEGGVGLFYGLHWGVIKDVGVVNATVTGYVGVGGLVGVNAGTMSNSYFSGNVTGGEWYIGGLMGWNEGTVNNSYSTGSVTGNWNVGGLVGANGGTVSDSYSTGSVTGNSSVGGLVGTNGGTVSNSYSTGNVTGNQWVGGLVGDKAGEGSVSNSFWDIETSGQATSDGGTGNTTAEMKDITTFSGAGWNITAVANLGLRNHSYIWNTVNGVTYPFLSWQS